MLRSEEYLRSDTAYQYARRTSNPPREPYGAPRSKRPSPLGHFIRAVIVIAAALAVIGAFADLSQYL